MLHIRELQLSFLKKPLIIFLIMNILSMSLAFGDSTIIQKDEKAPYTGMLFDIPAAQEIRKKLIEADLNKDINESYKKSLDLYKSNEGLYKQEKDILLNRNDELAKELYKERQTSDWTKVMWFGLGVVATGLAVYGAKQITK